MNTINSQVQSLAMDGQALYIQKISRGNTSSKNVTPVIQSGAEVAQSIEKNIAEIKADSQELQKLTEISSGRKLQFNVNKELGSVVIKIVDSNTNQVLKEIPSEDMQRLKIRIRKTLGSFYNKMI